jgi:hypothetical protein
VPDYNYKRVTATGVSVISVSQMGVLHGICLNQQSTAAVSTSLATLYDNTTNAGNVIGIIQLNNSGVSDYLYDALYANGLSINISGGAAPVDITFIYR